MNFEKTKILKDPSLMRFEDLPKFSTAEQRQLVNSLMSHEEKIRRGLEPPPGGTVLICGYTLYAPDLWLRSYLQRKSKPSDGDSRQN